MNKDTQEDIFRDMSELGISERVELRVSLSENDGKDWQSESLFFTPKDISNIGILNFFKDEGKGLSLKTYVNGKESDVAEEIKEWFAKEIEPMQDLDEFCGVVSEHVVNDGILTYVNNVGKDKVDTKIKFHAKCEFYLDGKLTSSGLSTNNPEKQEE